MMKIQLLVDNPKSWFMPYANELESELKRLGYDVFIIEQHDSIEEGDILVLLSCGKICKNLHLNKHNIVVHDSNLPNGRGWSPATWLILDGQNDITVTLFEAQPTVDSGRIYYQDQLHLNGTELIDEWQYKSAQIIKRLVHKFIENYPNNIGIEQQGEPTYYSKRTPKDSELDLNKTLDEQFNLLRVCDNKQYPSYFIKNGIKYILKIEKEK
mgnify:CR=1 FL=1